MQTRKSRLPSQAKRFFTSLAAGGEEVPIEVMIGCTEGAAATDDVFEGFEEPTMVDVGVDRAADLSGPGQNIGSPQCKGSIVNTESYYEATHQVFMLGRCPSECESSSLFPLKSHSDSSTSTCHACLESAPLEIRRRMPAQDIKCLILKE